MLGECFTPLRSLISPQTGLELCLSVLELIRINLTLPPKCLGLKACTAMPGRHYTHGLPASAFPAGRTTGLYHQTWFLKSLYFSLLLFGWGCSWVVEHLPSICEVLGYCSVQRQLARQIGLFKQTSLLSSSSLNNFLALCYYCCCSGFPGTHYVDETDLQLREVPLPLPPECWD